MKILVLGDLHLPFVLWDALSAAQDYAKYYKPDLVIQVGDIIDAYNWSLYPRASDSPNAEAEWDATEIAMDRFRSLFAKYPVTILSGNHDRRTMLRAFGVNLPRRLIKNLEDVFQYENWTWHLESKPLVIDKTIFIHGDEMMGNAWQKAQKLGQSLVQGHDHLGYLQYIVTFNHRIFGMSVGTMMDANSIAGRYAAKNAMRSWVGFATITNGVPNLIPL